MIIERSSALTMDSATVGIPKGDPNYYKIHTKWNMRLTWTGEFIHSAPWSMVARCWLDDHLRAVTGTVFGPGLQFLTLNVAGAPVLGHIHAVHLHVHRLTIAGPTVDLVEHR